MPELKPTIFVVDDDPSVRKSTGLMLKLVGFDVKTFVSAQDFLKANVQADLGCLILDVRMPGISGLALQEKLVSARTPLPVIFITGHGTVPMSVRAMKAGAVDFLQKPFEEQDLLDAVNRAITQQRERKSERDEADKLQQCLQSLTSREYEVFSLLVTGMANKEIAYKLGTSERTVKAHRCPDHGEDECPVIGRPGPLRREVEELRAKPLTSPWPKHNVVVMAPKPADLNR